jgi:hypothetical protein
MKYWAYVTVAALLAFAASVDLRAAQTKTLTAIGPVKSVSGSFFTVDANKTTMKFNVDAKTSIHVRGATAKKREKKEAGGGGLIITDVVHEGDQVLVKYSDVGGTLLASDVEVRRARPAAALPVK